MFLSKHNIHLPKITISTNTYKIKLSKRKAQPNKALKRAVGPKTFFLVKWTKHHFFIFSSATELYNIENNSHLNE